MTLCDYTMLLYDATTTSVVKPFTTTLNPKRKLMLETLDPDMTWMLNPKAGNPQETVIPKQRWALENSKPK